VQFQVVSQFIADFINNEVKERKSEGVVIGLSGGLDSSVTACLAVKALGRRNVFGLILPDSKNISPKVDIDDALLLAKFIGIKYKIIRISTTKKELLKQFPKNKLAQGNLAARLRMSILYYYAAILRRLVIGTSDKSELKLGYYTKYGDNAVDLLPIAGLYKTEVRKLGRFLAIPPSILQKKSSARLWKGHTAEGEIGMPYEEVDEILKFLDTNAQNGYNNRYAIDKLGLSTQKINRLVQFIEKNRHKQDSPPICEIPNEKLISVDQI
jgi:NAD+ synthase